MLKEFREREAVQERMGDMGRKVGQIGDKVGDTVEA